MSDPQARRRLLVLGAGYTGRIVADALTREDGAIQLVGVLDDDQDSHGRLVGGCPVLGPIDRLEEVVAQLRVEEVVIAIPSLRGSRLREVAAMCRRVNVASRTMPSIVELLGQPITPRQLRPVELGDLLRRAEIQCNEAPADYLRGARVLITGAGGSIGSELARQITRARPASIILLGHGENSIHGVHSRLAAEAPGCALHPVIADVKDRGALARVFASFEPTAVFHAAAHKHVPLMESHAAEAVRNNVSGTRNVLDCSARGRVERFVFISTDKAVAPAGIMGATKRLGEWLVHEAASHGPPDCLTVRFGNVLGSRGSVVPVLERQIVRGGPVTLTHPDMQRFFMTVSEAVHLVLSAGRYAGTANLIVLDMGQPVRIVDLAADLIRLSGMEQEDIEVVYSGLRPGEKLIEALWEQDSTVEPLEQRGLLRVHEMAQRPAGEALRAIVDRLERAAAAGDDADIHRLLSENMPSFISSRPQSDAAAR